ncbi:UbiA family prenyltransferase [Nocardia sp. NPDC052566]|uniref:UbiA family prenyltransferase n=1 Tax=Nocardia sp. NPDC052566 TaxID=3364330 RepID=UPI0037C5C5D1
MTTIRPFVDIAMRRVVGATAADRVDSMLGSIRLSTRIWFDVLAPLTMFCVLFTHWVALWKVLTGGLVILALHIGATFVNDAMDTDVDAASSEKSRATRALVTGRGRATDFIVIGAGLSAVGVGLAFALSPLVGVLVVGVVAVTTAYNTPPLRLSGRPVWAQLMWFAIWLLMFGLIGSVVDTEKWARAWPFGVFVAVFMGIGEGIAQDVRDADNDGAGGRRTTPVVFGVARSCRVATAAQAIAIGPWLLFCGRYPMPSAVIALGTSVLVVWVVVMVRLTRRLALGFDKAAAKWTHVGSIVVFGVLNLLTLAGILLPRG